MGINCPICKDKIIKQIGFGESMTLVGYFSEPGHNHDDNCRKRLYLCKNNHKFALSKINKCHCGWEGKKDCFCHKGEKVNSWPDVPYERTEEK